MMSQKMLLRLMPWLAISLFLLVWEVTFLIWDINRSLLVPASASSRSICARMICVCSVTDGFGSAATWPAR